MNQWKPEIQFRNPESLTPYIRNAKTHPTEQIDKIAAQIASVGFTVPIVVDKDGVIIAGHGRREASIRLGLKEVPVIVASHLDEYQVMAARIADNRVGESSWDYDVLKFDLGSLQLREFDLKLTGFDLPELNALLAPVADLEFDSQGSDEPTEDEPQNEGFTLEVICPTREEANALFEEVVSKGFIAKVKII